MDRALEDAGARPHRGGPELEGGHREGEAPRQLERPAVELSGAELGLPDEAVGLGDAGLLLRPEPDLRGVGHL